MDISNNYNKISIWDGNSTWDKNDRIIGFLSLLKDIEFPITITKKADYYYITSNKNERIVDYKITLHKCVNKNYLIINHIDCQYEILKNEEFYAEILDIPKNTRIKVMIYIIFTKGAGIVELNNQCLFSAYTKSDIQSYKKSISSIDLLGRHIITVELFNDNLIYLKVFANTDDVAHYRPWDLVFDINGTIKKVPLQIFSRITSKILRKRKRDPQTYYSFI